MMSLIATIGMVGILLLTIICLGQADICFSQTTQEQQCNNIRQYVLNGVNNNQIVFKTLSGSTLVNLPARTKSRICRKLIKIHNSQNKVFLEETEVTFLECTGAFSSPPPQQYTTASQLDGWTGIHCGTWYQSGGPQVVDNMEIQTPMATSPFTQAVVYFNRGTPCCDPFNEIGQGNLQGYVIGYDPKDNVHYDCHQGTYVGWGFTASGGGAGSADCLVKVTETEAFLECIKSVGGGYAKRTSAGFFNNYAHYRVMPLGSTCP